MEKYESRQQQIRRPAEQIYSVISDFNNFTPVVQGHVEDWTADETSCSFKVKGMTMRLRMVDKVPNDYVKVTGDERSPLDLFSGYSSSRWAITIRVCGWCCMPSSTW